MQPERVGIFPYSTEIDSFLKHIQMLKPSYQVCALISPRGWGLSGQIVASGCGKKEWAINSDFESIINEIDTLFIPEFNVDDAVETQLIEEIAIVIPRLKRVISSAKLIERNISRLRETCELSGCRFEDLNRLRNPEDYGLTRYIGINPPLERVKVPVVAVAGLWEETDKFEVSLALREKLINNGYCVTQIGSRNCCEMLGFHSFPGFLLDAKICAVDKVVYLNRWIKQLESSEKPDIILLSVPGCIQNLNESFTRGFGILHHFVFQAVTVDFLLFCTMYDFDSIKFLQELSLICKYRFGAEVDCFHMSNLCFDLMSSHERNKVIVNHVHRNTVNEALERSFTNSPIPILNLTDRISLDRLYEMVIDKLSSKDFQVTL